MNLVTSFRLLMQRHSVFFSTLAMQIRFEVLESVGTAATDGRAIFYSENFMHSLDPNERNAVFIHELLHLVLKHPLRKGSRDPLTWNLACFEKDAPVLTEHGYQSIHKILPGCKVLTREGKYENVLATHSKNYSGKLVTIKPHGCLAIKATSDHKFLVRGRFSKYSPVKLNEPIWKTVSEIEVGDYILIPKSQVRSAPLIPLSDFLSGENREILKGDLILDIESAWILGRYLADGSAMSDNSIVWTIGSSKYADAQRISIWLRSLGYSGRIDDSKKNVFRINFNSTAFRKLTEHYFGRGACNKQVPSFMFGQSNEIIVSFIKGWQSGDGCLTSTGTNLGWTCSENLALGIQRLAITAGISLDVRRVTRNRRLPNAQEKTTHVGYQIQTHKNQGSTRLLNGKEINSSGKRAKTLDDGLWIPIVKKDSVDFTGEVYTLSVENSGTYTVWNTTVKNCDLYVNEIIKDLPYCKLPSSAILDSQLWRETCEEIYELLLKDPDLKDRLAKLECQDLLSPGQEKDPQLEKNLDDILQSAYSNAKDRQQGNIPQGLKREIDNSFEEKVDWKTVLQNYLISSPNDFETYDRRFLSQGLYYESLSGSKVRVAVCVDTSGSICGDELNTFVNEVKLILQSHPQVECLLYWADSDLYGPYFLERTSVIPSAKGGGGTSFVPFFKEIAALEDKPRVAIYFTDGYGSFPKPPTDIDTLWLTTDRPAKDYPFGLAIPLKI
jgi:predicted metal-dependent peptidase